MNGRDIPHKLVSGGSRSVTMEPVGRLKPQEAATVEISIQRLTTEH